MDSATKELLVILKSSYESKHIYEWYKEYLKTINPYKEENIALEECFVSLAGIWKENFIQIINLLRLSQDINDSLIFKTTDDLEKRGMDIIASLTIYASISPIIEKWVKNDDIKLSICELMNNAYSILNFPVENDSEELSQARTKFICMIYLPAEIINLMNGREYRKNIPHKYLQSIFVNHNDTETIKSNEIAFRNEFDYNYQFVYERLNKFHLVYFSISDL